MEWRSITPSQQQRAIEAGTGRQDSHRTSSKHWLDDKGKCDSNIIGALGEILFRDYILEMRSCCPTMWHVEFAKMVVNRKQLKDGLPWDALVNGYSVEVKTILPSLKYNHLLVKKAEFKLVNYYVGVKLDSDNTYHFAGFATKQELFKNGLSEKFGNAPCYFLPLACLHPISIFMFFPPKE